MKADWKSNGGEEVIVLSRSIINLAEEGRDDSKQTLTKKVIFCVSKLKNEWLYEGRQIYSFCTIWLQANEAT
jgi:hypothetical protein